MTRAEDVISRIKEQYRDLQYMYHVASPNYRKGQPLYTLEGMIRKGMIKEKEALLYLYDKWPDIFIGYTRDDVEDIGDLPDDMQERIRDSFRRYMETDGREIHGYETFIQAKYHRDEWCNKRCPVLKIDVSDYDVRRGIEFDHPVIRMSATESVDSRDIEIVA